ELAHELAEIDAAVGGEIENQLAAVERLLHARELHPQPALAHFQHRDAECFLFSVLVLHTRDDVLTRREADDALRRIGRRTPRLLELRHAAEDGADRRTAVGLDDDALARTRRRRLVPVAGEIRLRAPHGVQLHGDERWRRWRRQGRAHNCSTSQSATLLIPTFALIADSASSIASNARGPRSP